MLFHECMTYFWLTTAYICIEIELTFVVLSLDNKMKKELIKGRKIKVDNIGKFILF